MTFNPVAALNVIECKNIIFNQIQKHVDLGSQTSSINNIFVKNLLNNNNLNNISKKI